MPTNRPTRTPRLLLESLESRRLLSATSTSTTITPEVATVTADLGRGPVFGGPEGGSGTGITNPTPASTALTPTQITAAYSIKLASTTGSGGTISIVDAYNDPNIAADLAVFDSEYELPAANLTVENELGQTTRLPQTDAGWSLEIALDVEWAHAVAPGAKIILVEASSASTGDLMTAVQTAAKQANVVSMSWGGSEFRGETAYDTAAYFANPNVTFIAASGDDGGAAGAEWPAVSPDVVAVGGTTLSLTSAGTTLSETAWSASGSPFTGYSGSTGGASLYESAPSYQVSALGSGVTKRETPDVSADANPSTGLSVYDSVAGNGKTGWIQVGGTSAGAPVWAGIIAAADQARTTAGEGALSSTQTLSLLYGISSSGSYTTDFHDINSGSNLVATAKTGYDMVTGLGSPVASNLIVALSATGTTARVAKVTVATTTSTSTPTSTSTTHATPHVQVVVAAATTATASTTAVAVSVPAGPVTTTSSESPILASSTAVSSPAATPSSAPTAAARPVQPLPQAAPVVLSSLAEGTAVLPPAPQIPIPFGPGLFLEPIDMRGIEAEALAQAIEPAPALSRAEWDAALQDVLDEDRWLTPSELSAPEPPAIEWDADELVSASPVVLAGLAVALGATWEYHRRRSWRGAGNAPSWD
jgi:subtilase family serine protease